MTPFSLLYTPSVYPRLLIPKLVVCSAEEGGEREEEEGGEREELADGTDRGVCYNS